MIVLTFHRALKQYAILQLKQDKLSTWARDNDVSLQPSHQDIDGCMIDSVTILGYWQVRCLVLSELDTTMEI